MSKITFVPIDPTYSKYNRVVSSSKDGVLCSSHEYITYSAAENVYSSDFSLGNLIAIGAVDKLQYVSMSLNSDMNFVDDFSKSYDSVSYVEKDS